MNKIVFSFLMMVVCLSCGSTKIKKGNSVTIGFSYKKEGRIIDIENFNIPTIRYHRYHTYSRDKISTTIDTVYNATDEQLLVMGKLIQLIKDKKLSNHNKTDSIIVEIIHDDTSVSVMRHSAKKSNGLIKSKKIVETRITGGFYDVNKFLEIHDMPLFRYETWSTELR
jgi:hypothetical protein